MKFLKENHATIIISLIVGVTIFYSQPLLESIGEQLVRLLASLSDSFSNQYYRSLALGNLNTFDQSNSSVLIIILSITLYSIYFFLLRLYDEVASKAEETLQSYEELIKLKESLDSKKENALNDEKDIDKKRHELISLEEIYESFGNFKKEWKKHQRRKRLVYSMVFMVITLYLVYYNASYLVNINLNKDYFLFNNRVIALTPYIGREEIDKLNSEWARMREHSDFIDINNKLSEAENNFFGENQIN